MLVIHNYIIPFKGYKCMNLFGILFSRVPKDKLDKIDLNHEQIHSILMLELAIIFALILFIIIILFGISWWWMLLSPCAFYIQYAIEYLIVRLFHKKLNDAYHDISLEEEAYNNEQEIGYLRYRKPFAFLKYLKIKSNVR